MKHIQLFEEFITENYPVDNTHTMKTKKLEVNVEKWEGGFWWLVDANTDEPIDGDKRKYVVLDMAKRWNMKIVNVYTRD